MYESLVRLTEGDKEVAWADQSCCEAAQAGDNVLHSQAQQALFSTLVAHSSPVRRETGSQRYSSPMGSSVGILTSTFTTDGRYSPRHPLGVSMAASGQLPPSTSEGLSSLAGRVLSVPAASPSQRQTVPSPHPSLPGCVDDTDHIEFRFPSPKPIPPDPNSKGQLSPLLSSTKMAALPRGNPSPPPPAPPLRQFVTTHNEVSTAPSSSFSPKQKLNLSELTFVYPSHPSPSSMPPPLLRRGSSPAVCASPSFNAFEDNFVSSKTQQQVPTEQSAFTCVVHTGGTPALPSRSRPFQPPIPIGPPPPPPPQPSPLRQVPIRTVAMPAFVSPLVTRHSQRTGLGGLTATASPFRSTTSAFFSSPLPPPPPLPQLGSSLLTQRQCRPPHQRKPLALREQASSSNDPQETISLRDSSPLYQPRTDEENEGKDKLNSTFTISSSSSSSTCSNNKPVHTATNRGLSESLPHSRLHASSTTAKDTEERRESKPLATLQNNLTERKQPSYLALTKSAANKRVQHHGIK